MGTFLKAVNLYVTISFDIIYVVLWICPVFFNYPLRIKLYCWLLFLGENIWPKCFMTSFCIVLVIRQTTKVTWLIRCVHTCIYVFIKFTNFVYTLSHINIDADSIVLTRIINNCCSVHLQNTWVTLGIKSCIQCNSGIRSHI